MDYNTSDQRLQSSLSLSLSPSDPIFSFSFLLFSKRSAKSRSHHQKRSWKRTVAAQCVFNTQLPGLRGKVRLRLAWRHGRWKKKSRRVAFGKRERIYVHGVAAGTGALVEVERRKATRARRQEERRTFFSVTSGREHSQDKFSLWNVSASATFFFLSLFSLVLVLWCTSNHLGFKGRTLGRLQHREEVRRRHRTQKWREEVQDAFLLSPF